MRNIYLYILFLFLGVGWTSASFALQQQEKNKTIQNQKTSFELIAYPSPAKTEVSIKMNKELKESTKELTLVNLIGREVSQQNVTDNGYNDDLKFYNLQQFPNGIYMIIAKDEYGNILHTVKLYIQH